MECGIRVGTGRHVFQKELAVINDRAAAIYAEIKALARTGADMRRLMEIPGLGPTIATASVAAIGTGSSFGKGRDLAAWQSIFAQALHLRGPNSAASRA